MAESLGPTAASPSDWIVAAALASTDRFWINAPTDSRIDLLEPMIEALLNAGKRTLVLTATAATANRVAERYRERGAVRAMAPGESTAVWPATLAEQASTRVGVGRVEEQRARLAERIRVAADRLDALRRVGGVWDRLRAARCACAAHGRTANPERAHAESELNALREELAGLAPLVAAKNAGHVFTRAFWKATFHGDLLRRAEELNGRIHTVEVSLANSDDTPLPARGSPFDPAEFERNCGELRAAGVTPPDAPTDDAIAAAQRAAEGERQEIEANLSFATKTLADLESDPVAAAVLLLNRAAIVVGPIAARTDWAVERGTFDCRILEGAESVTETEWEAAASTTDRSIVLGDFAGDGPASRQWRHEHRPQWLRDGDRLVARLAPDAAPERAEPLADRPEIELRFGRVAGEFVLAAVAFPDAMPLAEAKSFLATDLDEVRLEPFGPARWSNDELAVAWPTLESDDAVWIAVAEGVDERVVPVDGLPATAGARFDATRWTRAAAEAWVEAKSRARRTATLAPRSATVPCP